MKVHGNYPLQVRNNKLSAHFQQRPVGRPEGTSFERVLEEQIQDQKRIKFSKHAMMRLDTRNISLTQRQMDKIEHGVQKAEQKGIKDFLLLMEDMALVVNVPSRTVITAMDKNETKENVFTNIDGAVWL